MNVVKTIDISVTPERVYSYLLDFPRHSEWTTPGHDVRIEPASEGATVVGSVFNSEGHQMGEQRDRLEVTELRPNHKLVYEATMKNGSKFRHTLELETTSAGTRLSKRFESLRIAFPGPLMAPFVATFILPKALEGDLRRMKANLENKAG